MAGTCSASPSSGRNSSSRSRVAAHDKLRRLSLIGWAYRRPTSGVELVALDAADEYCPNRLAADEGGAVGVVAVTYCDLRRAAGQGAGLDAVPAAVGAVATDPPGDLGPRVRAEDLARVGHRSPL